MISEPREFGFEVGAGAPTNDRSNPPVESEVPAPAYVRVVLRRACYDCHSNETDWAWYSKVAPVSWLVADDVRDGRKKVNLSTWNRSTPEQRVKKLKQSWEQVEKGEMPLWIYTPTRRDAVLSPEDKAILREWAPGTPEKAPPVGPTRASPPTN